MYINLARANKKNNNESIVTHLAEFAFGSNNFRPNFWLRNEFDEKCAQISFELSNKAFDFLQHLTHDLSINHFDFVKTHSLYTLQVYVRYESASYRRQCFTRAHIGSIALLWARLWVHFKIMCKFLGIACSELNWKCLKSTAQVNIKWMMCAALSIGCPAMNKVHAQVNQLSLWRKYFVRRYVAALSLIWAWIQFEWRRSFLRAHFHAIFRRENDGNSSAPITHARHER